MAHHDPDTRATLDAFELAAGVREAIVAHARRDLPDECCGLLVGHGRIVTASVPMQNTEASPTRFRIDDREHIALRRSLRHTSPPRCIIGVYHSHPSGPARPSARDLAEAHYNDWLYVVIGFSGAFARVRGFALDSGRMRPTRLRQPAGEADFSEVSS